MTSNFRGKKLPVTDTPKSMISYGEPDPDDIYDLDKINRINALERMGIHVEFSESDIIDMRKLDALVARQMQKEKLEGRYIT